MREGSNTRDVRNNWKGHTVNWAKLKYFDKQNNWKGRKIQEAIYINVLNPSIEESDESKIGKVSCISDICNVTEV